MTRFRKAFLWTAIPIVALSILSTAGRAYENAYFIWYGAGVVWMGVIIVALAGDGEPNPSRREQQVKSGIVAGVGVGALALAVTCFTNLAALEIW